MQPKMFHIIGYFYRRTIKSLIFVMLLCFVCIFLLTRAYSFTTFSTNVDHTKKNTFLPNCEQLFGDHPKPVAFESAIKWEPGNEHYSDLRVLNDINQSCDNFLRKRKYFLNLPNIEEEKGFPIAFSIVTFKSFVQFERLLRTIYRPWNYYCIHVDTKSDNLFFNIVNELVKCLGFKYNNIINTENRVDVEWGHMSVLTADLNCMKELYKKFKNWKYLINLTGQEFPLKTNAELVKILKTYQGANNLEGTYKRRNENRVPIAKMPFPMVWFKGSVHITVNRDFIGYIFESPKSNVLLKALEGRLVPDEQFFSTLNHNPSFRIPGSYIGDPDEDVTRMAYPLESFLTRYKNWGDVPCKSGKFVRSICIWGVADLPTLTRVPHLFANKFYEDFQPAALHCLEKWYYSKIDHEVTTGNVTVNKTFYASMPFVKYRYIPPPSVIV